MNASSILLCALLVGSFLCVAQGALAEVPTSSGGQAASKAQDVPSDAAAADSASDRRLRLSRPLETAADFAPAGVTLDHTHAKGNWTFSYRYSRASYSDLLEGTRAVDVGDALADYVSVPTDEVINEHLFGVMYAPRNRFTFALMLPYVTKEIDYTDGVSASRWETRGIGDAQLLFLIPFVQKGEQQTHVRVGMSFPTGSIFETDATGARLPYSMQLGSGTWDIQWALTYTGKHDRISWGSQFEGLYRIGMNEVGYRLGTDYEASAWMTGGIWDWVSVSGRFLWTHLGNIRGEDSTLDKTVNPLNDNKKRGATRLAIGPGINILLPFLGGQRISLEVIIPVYQNLDGPQLEENLTFTGGWQWVF